MGKRLEEIGFFDTPENNTILMKHLLEVGKRISQENREWVRSVLHGTQGSIEILSTWVILPDGKAYLSTLQTIPMKKRSLK